MKKFQDTGRQFVGEFQAGLGFYFMCFFQLFDHLCAVRQYKGVLHSIIDQLVNRCLWGDSSSDLNNRCVYRRTRSVNSD
jgi:hypothetical protein